MIQIVTPHSAARRSVLDAPQSTLDTSCFHALCLHLTGTYDALHCVPDCYIRCCSVIME